MSKADATHFDDYRKQTEVKHRILQAYLPAYFLALSGTYQSIGYIDGFAGRGSYSDEATGALHDGSPLLALKLIARDAKLASRVHSFFVESRADHFTALKIAIDEFLATKPGIIEPKLRQGRFADHVQDRLRELAVSGGRLAPTFLFVDPCGVDGTSFQTIASILQTAGSELFLFFNSAGITRVVGASLGTGESDTLTDLYGSRDRVAKLLATLGQSAGAPEIEEYTLAEYCDALRTHGRASFILPYRIEAASRQNTSHYLIHASKSPLGFKIMKHVMLEMIQPDGASGGLLEFRQASARLCGMEIRFDLAELRLQLLQRIRHSPTKAAEFFDQWVTRPTDFYSEGEYRRQLLDLEQLGEVEIFKDRECKQPYPAAKRTRKRPRSEEKMVTLSENCWRRHATKS